MEINEISKCLNCGSFGLFLIHFTNLNIIKQLINIRIAFVYSPGLNILHAVKLIKVMVKPYYFLNKYEFVAFGLLQNFCKTF